GVAQWAANGVALTKAPLGQDSPQLVSDAAGGAIAFWLDQRAGTAGSHDLYAQRVLAGGALAGGAWAPDGDSLCVLTFNKPTFSAASDGAGGALVGWEDDRFGTSNPDIYAQHIAASGLISGTVDVAAGRAPAFR